MTRYIGPFLFLATGAYVFWYNAAAEGGRFLLFPFLEPVVGKDLGAQAMASAGILVGLGAISFLLAFTSHLTVLFPKKDPEPGPDDDIGRSM